MNNQSIQMTLRNILDAMMTINVKGNDAVILVDCMRALQQVINAETAVQAQPVDETKSAEE